MLDKIQAFIRIYIYSKGYILVIRKGDVELPLYQW